MAYVPTPRDMRHRRETFVGSKMGPKHDWVYRAAPPLGDTDTGVKLFDTNKSFAILTAFHCPGLTEPSDKAPAQASGHACGFASMAGSGKLGIRLQHIANASAPNIAWMGYGGFGPVFGFNGGGGPNWACGSFKPFSAAGGRTLTIHRSKAIDESGNPTSLDGGASFELCGVAARVSGKGTFTASATETLHVYSCEEIVMDMVVVYLRELTKEEEQMWRTYGLLP